MKCEISFSHPKEENKIKKKDIEIAEFIYIFECQMSRVKNGNSVVK